MKLLRKFATMLPRASINVTSLTGISAAVLAWAQSAFHWADTQTTAASGAAIATIALVTFVIEHLRNGTASRWVGVLGMIPAEVSAVVLLGVAFAWWDTSALKVSTFVLALITPLAAIFGVTIAQGKVTSPETLQKGLTATAQEVAAAKAAVPETNAR